MSGGVCGEEEESVRSRGAVEEEVLGSWRRCGLVGRRGVGGGGQKERGGESALGG